MEKIKSKKDIYVVVISCPKSYNDINWERNYRDRKAEGIIGKLTPEQFDELNKGGNASLSPNTTFINYRLENLRLATEEEIKLYLTTNKTHVDLTPLDNIIRELRKEVDSNSL